MAHKPQSGFIVVITLLLSSFIACLILAIQHRHFISLQMTEARSIHQALILQARKALRLQEAQLYQHKQAFKSVVVPAECYLNMRKQSFWQNKPRCNSSATGYFVSEAPDCHIIVEYIAERPCSKLTLDSPAIAADYYRISVRLQYQQQHVLVQSVVVKGHADTTHVCYDTRARRNVPLQLGQVSYLQS